MKINNNIKIMKKYFAIAALAALALASCGKNDVPETTGNAISFNTYSATATRANGSFVSGTDFSSVAAADQIIGVYAWNTGATAWADYTMTKPNFFSADNGVAVTLQGNGGTASATYDPVRYWPTDKANNKLTFFAYYPHTSKASGLTVNDDAAAIPTFEFTVQDAAADQVDFMVADPVADQTYDSNTADKGTVPFVFKHKLTQVKVYVKLSAEYAGATVKLDSLAFSGLKNKGTYTYDATAAISNWSATSGDASYTVFNNAAGAALSTTEQQAGPTALSATGDNAYIMLLLPQELTNAKYSIKYSVDYGDGNVVVNRFKDQALKTDTVADWAPNKNVKYTFSIGFKEIKFTATAGAWEDGGTQPIDINN